ncbi:polysaccharide deacetylase family protein [Streptomyces olivaceoviridis]|uniref:polysaccharide deacetylase family protein n=1 Tax=Streptomyces olivaceoviridis TaxID=1921 RepID=UPI0033A8C034
MALTFDDGPTQYTPSILRLLEKHHATATFFVIGPHALQHPTTVLREQHDGDTIGDHTVTHPHLTAVSSARVRFELDRAAHGIASVTGHRPPADAAEAAIRRLRLANKGPGRTERAGRGDVEPGPQDWRHISPGTIDRRLLNHVRAGDIVSLHDRHARTLTALPRILTGLASSGFVFVTVPQMLAGSGGTHPGMLYHHGPRT